MPVTSCTVKIRQENSSFHIREHHTVFSKMGITRFLMYFLEFKLSNHTVRQKSAILLFEKVSLYILYLPL